MSRLGPRGFSDEELEYYSRQMVLPEVGVQGQLRLKEGRVCVVGLGGLGSPLSLQLASMGVGHLRIVDRDVVEVSNLQRQHLYSVDMVGYPKVEAAARRLRGLNPFIEVEPLPLSLNSRTAERIVRGVDVVVDGLDRMAPRYDLNRACVRLGVPYIYGAAITHFGSASTIIPGQTACLDCFQGGLDDASLPSCAVVGVNPSILSIVSSIQASEALRILLGRRPKLANILLYCDLEGLTFDRIELKRSEGCRTCGGPQSAEASQVEPLTVEEICGREGKRVFVVTPEERDVEMGELRGRLAYLGYRIDVAAELGTSFSSPGGVKGSILKSGVAVLEGIGGREEAEAKYRQISSSRGG